jgi:DNA uptake protein ComE-like DNA-binding protein
LSDGFWLKGSMRYRFFIKRLIILNVREKKPGLSIGNWQRIADLVASASGFTQDADPLYLAKNLNLATELKDQDKVYIPFLAEKNDESEDAANQQEDSSSTNKSLISINQASLNELQTLSGIGVVKAQAIVDQRPYSNLDELVSKKVEFRKILLIDLPSTINFFFIGT